MAQVSTAATAQANKTIVPTGGGGLPGHLLRMVVMVLSGGFIFPNTFVEGMDPTAMQKVHEIPVEKSNKQV
jgi:hypothetical protein